MRISWPILLFMIMPMGNTTPTAHASLDDTIHAIHMTEAGGRMHPPDGDNRLAIGPFQEHYIYWFDATHEKRIGPNGRLVWIKVHPGTYQDCRKFGYARQVMIWYWQKHCPAALSSNNAQVLARVHNGGPDGATQRETLKYWKKVRKHL